MRGALGLTACLVAFPVVLASATLQPHTLEDWDRYIAQARQQAESRANGGKFLWIRETDTLFSQLRAGRIVASPGLRNGRTNVRDGLIHDWIGAVFLPGVTAAQVFRTLDAYDAYTRMYPPIVVDSRVLHRDGNLARFTMTFERRAGLGKNVLEADYESLAFPLGPDRWWTTSRSLRIQQVENFREETMRRLPEGTGAGYVWRLYTITRALELDGGTILEVQAIGLSRDIPAAVAWFVDPIVSRFCRSSLVTSLRQTRAAVIIR